MIAINFKITWLIFLSTFFLISISAQDWHEISSGGYTFISSVALADTNEIYITADHRIYKSVDQANSFDLVWEADSQLKSVYTSYCSDFGRVYAAHDLHMTNWAKMLYSDDGGITWVEKAVPLVNEPTMIYFLNSEIGFIGGDQRLVKTIDGGDNWDLVLSDSWKSFHSMQFLSDSIGVVAAGSLPQSGIYLTKDGGDTWEQKLALGPLHYKVHFPSKDVGYLCSYTEISKSTDGGETWTPLSIELADTSVFRTLHFVNEEVGFVVTQDYLDQTGGWHYGATIFKTVDGGKTWVESLIDSEQVYHIVSMNFAGTFGIMVGDKTGVYTTDLVDVELVHTESIQDRNISIYPNPAQDFLVIETDKVLDYEILDATGRSYIQGKTSGVVYISKLAAGSYFVHIKIDQVSMTLPFIKR